MGNTLPAANAYFYLYLYLYTCISASEWALQMLFDSRLSRRKLLKSLELRLSGFPHRPLFLFCFFSRPENWN